MKTKTDDIWKELDAKAYARGGNGYHRTHEAAERAAKRKARRACSGNPPTWCVEPLSSPYTQPEFEFQILSHGPAGNTTHTVNDGGVIYYIAAPFKSDEEVAEMFRDGYDGTPCDFEVNRLTPNQTSQ